MEGGGFAQRGCYSPWGAGDRGGGVVVSFIHPSILSRCLLPHLRIITHDAATTHINPTLLFLTSCLCVAVLCCTGHYVALLVLFIGAAGK